MKKKKPQTASKNSKNPNANPAIAYQNKDIVSKLFGEQMKANLFPFWLKHKLKGNRYPTNKHPYCPGKRTSHG